MDKKTDGRKVIAFDMDDPVQNELFRILDKFRYFQSKLIIKLLADFFQTYGITVDMPYKELKAIIKLYLNNGEMKGFVNSDKDSSQKPPEQSALSFSAEALVPFLTSIMSQQASMQAQLNGMAMPGLVMSGMNIPLPTESNVVEVKTETHETTLKKEDSKESSNSKGKAQTKEIFSFEDDEEDDDDESIKNVASSFKAMLG